MRTITDEEIIHQAELGQYAHAYTFIQGAQWYRSSVETQKEEFDLSVVDLSKVSPEDFVQNRHNPLTPDECFKSNTEKEIPFKPITVQAYDGSTISRHLEDFDWRGINIPTLDEALKKEIKDHPEQLYKGQGHIKVPFLTKDDLWRLADICWYIKGFVASQKEKNNNEFGQRHVDVLTKVINDSKI